MKIDVMFKNPEALDKACENFCMNTYGKTYRELELEYFRSQGDKATELENLREEAYNTMQKIKAIFRKYTSYNECIKVEIDTENETMVLK